MSYPGVERVQRAVSFPMPRCEGCGARDACARQGQLRPEYPACRRPLRGASVARTAELLDWLGAHAPPTPAAPELHRLVLARFGQDRLAYSDVLEPSLSVDARGVHLHRFSFGLPGLRRDEAGVGRTLLALGALFGEPCAQACRTVLRAARSAAVAQPIFGFAAGPGGPRPKLYLQFHADRAPEALDLAGRLLGRPVGGVGGGAGLHLLGFDLGERGVAAAKLYFARGRMDLGELATLAGPVPVARDLAALGATELRDVLFIHRLDGPREPAPERPGEIDFSLPESDLSWSELRALPSVSALLGRDPAIAELEARFRLAVRRVSVSVGNASKLTAYYVLAESGA